MSTYDFDQQSSALPLSSDAGGNSVFSFAYLGSALQGLMELIWRNNREHEQKMDAASHTSFVGTEDLTKQLTDTTDPNLSTRMADQLRVIREAGRFDVNEV